MGKLLLRVGVALTLAFGLEASSFDDHMAKGRAAIASGDFATAEREYQAALREVHKHPGDGRVPLAYEGLADVAERRHDPAAAEEYLKELLAARQQATIGPVAELPTWLDLKRFYAKHKRWTDAAAAADRLAGIWKECGGGREAGTAQYLSAAGHFYHLAGDYTKAEERYRAAVPILEAATGASAALAQVLDRLANTLTAEDKRDEAEAMFQRATQLPGQARRDYVSFLRKAGRDDEANALEKGQPGFYHLGKGVTAPIATVLGEPGYTEAARKGHFMGTVIINMEIDPSGKPVNIQVLEPLGFGLDEKAIEAVEGWRFRPGVKDGQPVTVPATVEVNFRLL